MTPFSELDCRLSRALRALAPKNGAKIVALEPPEKNKEPEKKPASFAADNDDVEFFSEYKIIDKLLTADPASSAIPNTGLWSNAMRVTRFSVLGIISFDLVGYVPCSFRRHSASKADKG